MKKYILLSLIIFCLSGCAIIQNITFHKDGHISFRMFISNKQLEYIHDKSASELQELILEKTGRIKDNTTIAAGRLVRTSHVSLTDRQREGLALLAELQVQKNKDIFTPLNFVISGDFKNLDDLNKAFAAVPLLSQTVQGFEIFEEYGLNAYFEQRFVYTRKGDMFSVHSEPIADADSGIKETDTYKRDYIHRMFLTTYPYETIYKFPFDVKIVNSPNSSYSKREVRIQYPVRFFFKPEIADIAINPPGDLYIPFAIGSSQISTDDEKKIKELAGYLKTNPDNDVMIIGSADLSTGSWEFNNEISINRAMYIVGLLNEYGIRQPERVSVGTQLDIPLYASDKENRCAVVFIIKNIR